MLNVYKVSQDVTPLRPTGDELALSIKQVQTAANANVESQIQRHEKVGGGIKTVKLHSEEKDYIVRIAEKKHDPFDPSRFRTRKSIEVQDDDPEPIMTTPNRKLTPEEEKYWNVPPCVSNWRNPAGNVIPLDKRVAADGRKHIQPQLSDRFAPFTRALEQTMSSINEAAHQRAMQQRQLLIKQQQEEEEKQREEIKKLREEKLKLAMKKTKEELEHDRILREHSEERKRMQRKQRDISGVVGNGRTLTSTADDILDSTLFGRNGGIDQGFNDEGMYKVYDQPLFRAPEEQTYVPFGGSRKYSQAAAASTKSAGASSFKISFTKGETQTPIQKEGLYIPDKE